MGIEIGPQLNFIDNFINVSILALGILLAVIAFKLVKNKQLGIIAAALVIILFSVLLFILLSNGGAVCLATRQQCARAPLFNR